MMHFTHQEPLGHNIWLSLEPTFRAVERNISEIPPELPFLQSRYSNFTYFSGSSFHPK